MSAQIAQHYAVVEVRASQLLADAREAWKRMRRAEGEVRRLQRYTHPTGQMRDDLFKWMERRTAAEQVLVQILGKSQ